MSKDTIRQVTDSYTEYLDITIEAVNIDMIGINKAILTIQAQAVDTLPIESAIRDTLLKAGIAKQDRNRIIDAMMQALHSELLLQAVANSIKER